MKKRSKYKKLHSNKPASRAIDKVKEEFPELTKQDIELIVKGAFEGFKDYVIEEQGKVYRIPYIGTIKRTKRYERYYLK